MGLFGRQEIRLDLVLARQPDDCLQILEVVQLVEQGAQTARPG